MPQALVIYDTIASAVKRPALIVAQMNDFEGKKPASLANHTGELEVVSYKDYLTEDRPVGKSYSSFVIRKDVNQDVVGLRYERQRTLLCEDDDFLLRAGVHGQAILIINPPTIAYRTHKGNVSRETKRVAQGVLSLIRSEKKGFYAGGRSRMLDRHSFIGGVVFAWSKKAFSRSCPYLGLRLFVSGFQWYRPVHTGSYSLL